MDANTKQNLNGSGLESLLEQLLNEDAHERHTAREKLVAIGERVLEPVGSLLDHPKHLYRWEALKVMSLIGAPKSIPAFIAALEDEKGDIQWLAADGLIRTGKHAIKPLLKAIRENDRSVLLLHGAHHVFSELRDQKELPEDFPTKKLLKALTDLSENASLKVMVHNLLEDLN
ncbi:HEAT repeat domain-containing protein [Mangrovibacterium diazotrophicum]|uniref:HEAT repeat protein n=1 Tax=Mangrovibacterium diazotrophicum TaxID=1261403 RepID=A0A419VX85_9BACT|nr:HEAT repeat domain-containing protein [Mangrovibacterium diazotrophicum]RKD87789.1 HEAT repeat protein [Mangrovibacterium diazotrophicum]